MPSCAVGSILCLRRGDRQEAEGAGGLGRPGGGGLRCWVKEGALCVRCCEQLGGASLGETGSVDYGGSLPRAVGRVAGRHRRQQRAVWGGAQGRSRWAWRLGPSGARRCLGRCRGPAPAHWAGQAVGPTLRGGAGARPAGRDRGASGVGTRQSPSYRACPGARARLPQHGCFSAWCPADTRRSRSLLPPGPALT